MDGSASQAIVEHDDRWLIKPLRGRSVSRIDWKSDHFELVLDDPRFRFRVGYCAELSAKSIAKESANRHKMDYWSRSQIEQFLDSKIVSAVFFKNGAVRLAFKNGWILLIDAAPQAYSPELQFGDHVLWKVSGIVDYSLFEIRPIDAWTGQPVTPPHWPGRPENLLRDPETDDIND